MTSAPGTHRETESDPWTIAIPDHPARTETPAFRHAKDTCHAILATLAPEDLPYGPGPWQMHHGGSLWALTDDGWRMWLARAGIEYSMQFCCDPAKVERLRVDYSRLLDAYPATRAALLNLGYNDIYQLGVPITDAAGVAFYTDSLANSCVPLSAVDHTAVLPAGAGAHHYPWPVKCGDFVRRDDFVLWVLATTGHYVAVAPVAPRGSGDGRVAVLYAAPHTKLGLVVAGLHQSGKRLVLPADSPLAQQAFAAQTA